MPVMAVVNPNCLCILLRNILNKLKGILYEDEGDLSTEENMRSYRRSINQYLIQDEIGDPFMNRSSYTLAFLQRADGGATQLASNEGGHSYEVVN